MFDYKPAMTVVMFAHGGCIVCFQALPLLFRRPLFAFLILPQLCNRILEIPKVGKVTVNAGEPHIRHLIQFAQRLKDGCTNFLRSHFCLTAGTQIFLHTPAELLKLVIGNRPALACLAHAIDDLIPAERLDVAIILQNEQLRGFNRRKTLAALRALTTTTNGRAVIVLSCIDNLRLRVPAKRAIHAA